MVGTIVPILKIVAGRRMLFELDGQLPNPSMALTHPPTGQRARKRFVVR